MARQNRSSWLRFRRDRSGVAAIEAAFILPPFLILIFLIIETGAYFTLQASLDAGVLTAGETLRTAMLAGSAFAPPTAAALKTTIITNGGALLSASAVILDVQALATLSAGAVAIVDGTVNWGGSGSVLILRAQATMPFLPGTTTVTMTSISILRRPPY
jgi:Flp pilus assembly protein TadG